RAPRPRGGGRWRTQPAAQRRAGRGQDDAGPPAARRLAAAEPRRGDGGHAPPLGRWFVSRPWARAAADLPPASTLADAGRSRPRLLRRPAAGRALARAPWRAVPR